MKAMTREELAYRAGVDRKTFYSYLSRHKDELCAMGMRPFCPIMSNNGETPLRHVVISQTDLRKSRGEFRIIQE